MKLESKTKQIKQEKSYGTLTLNSANFPFVKDLSLTDEAEFTVKVKIKTLRTPDNWEISEEKLKPTDVIAHVDIKSISHKPMKK